MTDGRNEAAERVARAILGTRGLDLDAASPGRGWTNATWLTDEFVIRVATRPGPADLLRETRMAALLPEQVGYPEIVGAGVLRGHEWVLTRRIRAENLEDVWPALDGPSRADAVEQVWAKAELIHDVDVDAAAPFVRRRSPFFAASPAEAEAPLRRLAAAGLLTDRQLRVLGETLDRFWTALPAAPAVLNHGDLGTPNVLWADGAAVALLDLEFAVIEPVQIDLNEVIKFAYGPDRHHPEARDAVTTIAGRVLHGQDDADVLLGYSVMLEAWLTEAELGAADSVGGPADWEPYQLLTGLAAGDGGHLAPLLARL